MPSLENIKKNFLNTRVPKRLLVLHTVAALAYFVVITFFMKMGNPLLFGFLIAGEVFHIFQVLMYVYTVWQTEYTPRLKDPEFSEGVDVFVTVAGEPVDIVERTVVAIKNMDYPAFEVHILNDGYVAGKENWQEIESLAERLGVNCITRKFPGGHKAGNINNALQHTKNPYVTIFDADHIPHEDFLKKMMPYFADRKMAFVQSPQFYKNYEFNYITRSAWEQQEIFFGPICKGKNRINSATMCGTNMVILRRALTAVGGMCEESIAEDFVTGMLMHATGWKSLYVPEVLAEGLAPEDFTSYFKQQYRWGRGGLDTIFRYNLLFRRGLTFRQRLQYISSVSFYFSGLIVLINAFIPLAFLYLGLVPIVTSTMVLASFFLPYIFLTVYILQLSTNFSITFSSVAFSMAGFNIHLKAIWASITLQKSKFEVTPKRRLKSRSSFKFIVPHLLYIVLAMVGIYVAYMRTGLAAAFIVNSAWVLFNVTLFVPFMYAAIAPQNKKVPHPKKGLAATPSLLAVDQLRVKP